MYRQRRLGPRLVCLVFLTILPAITTCGDGITDVGKEEGVACVGGGRVVALLLDPMLAPSIRAGLSRYEADLCAEGYTVVEMGSPFKSAKEVRSWLMDLRTRMPELIGVLLVGDIPHAYQWVTLSSSSNEVISFQYYADLDGEFAASPGYTSPGNHPHSFDLHTGAVEWEIWVGVLPIHKGSRDSTVAAINRYFDKNHAYRSGGAKPPRAFLQVTEHHHATTQAEHDALMTAMRTGTYAWVPFSTAEETRFYFDSPPAGLSVDQGYEALTQGVADFFVQNSHGSWRSSGRLNIPWVESNPVNTIFFWSNGCAVGNIDHPDNFLSSSLYSTTSMVLLAKGTTNNSGGMGNNENGYFGRNVATSLSQGRSMGQALLDHVNVPLVWPWSESREFHFATAILLGDPTLRLRD